MKLQNGYDVNCIVETPEHIAEYMIEKLNIDYSSDFFLLEPAVGKGNIFVVLIGDYIGYALSQSFTNDRILHDLENRFYAFDIDKDSIEILIFRLQKLLEEFGIVNDGVKWKFSVVDLLEKIPYDAYKRITHCICNPPYIAYRNLSQLHRGQLKNFDSSYKGLPNLYYAFIELAIVNLPSIIRSVYINPSSYLIGKSAFKLREMITENHFIENISEFRDDVFGNAQVKVCITTFSKEKKTYSYTSLESNLNVIEHNDYEIQPLSHGFFDGELTDMSTDFILEDLFHVYGAIATLDDKFYTIQSDEVIYENSDKITIIKNNKHDHHEHFEIEKAVLKKIHTSSKRNNRQNKLIIYPYDERGAYLGDSKISDVYPGLWNYFKHSTKKTPSKLEFGRSQNLSNWNNLRYVIPKSISSFFFDTIKGDIVNSGICLEIKEEFKADTEEIIDALDNHSDQIFNFIQKQCIKNDSKYVALTTEVVRRIPVLGYSRKVDINDGTC